MGIYCMCMNHRALPMTEPTVFDYFSAQILEAPNRFCLTDPVGFPALSLPKRMQCIKTGAEQVILHKDVPLSQLPGVHDYRIHYPNVDVHFCPKCHAIVAIERTNR